MSWKELMVSASMAVGQLAAKERDRLMEKDIAMGARRPSQKRPKNE